MDGCIPEDRIAKRGRIDDKQAGSHELGSTVLTRARSFAHSSPSFFAFDAFSTEEEGHVLVVSPFPGNASRLACSASSDSNFPAAVGMSFRVLGRLLGSSRSSKMPVRSSRMVCVVYPSVSIATLAIARVCLSFHWLLLCRFGTIPSWFGGGTCGLRDPSIHPCPTSSPPDLLFVTCPITSRKDGRIRSGSGVVACARRGKGTPIPVLGEVNPPPFLLPRFGFGANPVRSSHSGRTHRIPVCHSL